MKVVMVFGTFDGVHPGHEYFLKAARALGDRLVVCIARDVIVETLKGRPPLRPEIERREALAECSSVDQVVYGDRELSTYAIVDEINPDVIALGYDQGELKRDLSNWLSAHGKQIEIVDVASYNPELYKSSLLTPAAGNRPGRNSA